MILEGIEVDLEEEGKETAAVTAAAMVVIMMLKKDEVIKEFRRKMFLVKEARNRKMIVSTMIFVFCWQWIMGFSWMRFGRQCSG